MNSLYLVLISIQIILTFSETQKECPNGWTQFENKCFLFYTDKSFLNFYESHIVCKDFFNATLVSIHSKEEQTFLTKYAFFTNKAQNHVWIGARRTFNETFVWEDNSAFNYTNWAKTQPNNLDGKHFCTSLLQSPNLSDLGFWYDDPCADKYHFICQIYLADNTLDSLNNSSALVINTSATVDNSTTERILTFDELKALHNNSANISTISALISSSTVKEKQHFSYYNTVLTVLAVVQLIVIVGLVYIVYRKNPLSYRRIVKMSECDTNSVQKF